MIRPIPTSDHATQLTCAKPRAGLQRIGDLIPRLIRQYEIQAEMNRIEKSPRVVPLKPPVRHQQATFAWYE